MCLAKEANKGAGSLLGPLEARDSVGLAVNEIIPTMNEANRRQQTLAIGQDNPISHHHSDYGGSTQSRQLVRKLRWARALNAFLFVGYLLALISFIDHEQLGHFWTRARTLNFQNFQSRVLGFKHKPPSPSGHPPSDCWSMQSHSELSSGMGIGVGFARTPMRPTEAIEGDIHYGATSCSPVVDTRSQRSSRAERISGSAASRTTNKPRPLASDESASPLVAANIRYYLLIVTLVDIIANRDWRKLKRALAGAMQSNESQLGPALEATSSLTGMSPEACRRGSTRMALARLVGSVSSLLLSSPKHLFQITQVALLMMFPPNFESALGGLVSLMSPVNTLNQMARFALESYQAHCHFELARNHEELAERELDQGRSHVTPADNGNNNDIDAHPSGASLNPLGLKRYLLISQIVHLKMTILALLVRLDSKPCAHSLELLTIIVCLVQTLSVMFATFNEFHTFHSRKSARDKLDKNNKIKVD